MGKHVIEINIDLGKKCPICQKGGAMNNGPCMDCRVKWMKGKIKINGMTYEQFRKTQEGGKNVR